MDLHAQPQRQREDQRGVEASDRALPPTAPQVERSDQQQIARVPQEARQQESPGVEPVENGEEQPFAPAESRSRPTIEDQERDDLGEQDAEQRRAMVGPQHERSADEESGEATGNRATGRCGIAVGHPLAARDQQPAARQQIELIAADLGTKREQQGERETDDEHGDDAEIGAVALGSPAVSRHGAQDSSAKLASRRGRSSRDARSPGRVLPLKIAPRPKRESLADYAAAAIPTNAKETK